jgi:hypothetical protein
MVNKVTILGRIKLSWIDSKLNLNDTETFKREIGKSTIYFFDGEIILRKKELPANPFKKLQKESKLSNKFITVDIETIKIENKVTPYLINAYDGRQHLTSYNKDENLLFQIFMNNLLSILEKGSINYIYAHNLSTFDGVLILKHLFNYGEVKPLLHNGKIISIKLIIKGQKEKDNITIFNCFLLETPH